MSDKELDDFLADDLDENPTDDRTLKVNAFLREVEKKVKVARARKKFDARTRIEAVRWLGEAGEPTAIETLVMLYKKDTTPGMKDAAAYALGQFRALEIALDDPELSAYAQEMLEDIIFEGRFGKPASPSPRLLKIAIGVLAVLLALLGGLSIALPAPQAEVVAQQPTSVPEAAVTDVEADLSALYQALDADAETLRVQLLNITRDQAPDCSVTFVAPAPYILPANITADSELGTIAAQLDEARTELDPLRNAYVNACNALQVIPAPQALTYSDGVVAVQRILTDVAPFLNIAPPDVPEATPEVIIEVQATPEATPEIVVEVDLSVYDTPIADLLFNIETMNNFRGHNTLLLQYWQDVSQSGSTGGCLNLPAPTLPLDYELAGDLVADAPEALTQAIDGYNLGMALSRSSWEAFASACASNTLADVVAIQLTTAQTAQSAFDEAQTLLNDFVFSQR